MTSRRLWRRVLERQMWDRYLAPHFIPTQDLSAEELLRHASRIYRLDHQFEHPEGQDGRILRLHEENVSYFGISVDVPGGPEAIQQD